MLGGLTKAFASDTGGGGQIIPETSDLRQTLPKQFRAGDHLTAGPFDRIGCIAMLEAVGENIESLI